MRNSFHFVYTIFVIFICAMLLDGTMLLQVVNYFLLFVDDSLARELIFTVNDE